MERKYLNFGIESRDCVGSAYTSSHAHLFDETRRQREEIAGLRAELSVEAYRTVHDAATAAYEAATPVDYRYSALALRKAVDAALKARAALASPDGEEKRGIYIASKTKHAERWRILRHLGEPIISTWIDEAGVGESGDLADLWRRCIAEAMAAQVLILYREPEDVAEAHRIADLITALRAERDDLRRKLFPYADATEVSGISFDGKYLIGDKASISYFLEMQNRGLQIDVYQRAYDERIAAAEAELARLRAATERLERELSLARGGSGPL